MNKKSLGFLAVTAIILTIFGCVKLPKVELASYTNAYTEVKSITDDVLDIVSPYERIVIKYFIKNKKTFVNISSSSSGELSDKCKTAQAQGVDISLIEECKTNSGTQRKQVTVPVAVINNPCQARAVRADPYCYQLRDAFADIGDPPLVKAYRRLSDLVERYNALLVAYSNGISGKLVAQDIDAFNSAVNTVVTYSPVTNISGASGFAAGYNSVAKSLKPIAVFAGSASDREQFRAFLLSNYDNVDTALRQMSENSGILFDNVANGTELFLIKTRNKTASLRTRRNEIRQLVANWTVLLDQSRELLAELKVAVENPNGLETRIRNLNESTVKTRIETEIVRKQIATLGTPSLSE